MQESPVTITPKAAKEVKNMLQRKKVPEGYQLRIGVRGGGCGGASFFLGFDTPKKDDKSFEMHGLPFCIDKRHILYLLDVSLDFEEREAEQGFVFLKG